MEITPQIHAIRTPLGPAKDRFVYVAVVYGRHITVIDTGFSGAEKLIFDDIRSSGRDPSEIDLVILTHHHPDHTGSAKTIRDLTGCTVAAHPADRDAIEHPDPRLFAGPAPGVPPLVAGPVPVGRLLGEGDMIDAGNGLLLRVLHVPGHTPGSIALFSERENVLITGDAVQATGRAPIFADPVALVRSIRRLASLPGLARCLPGHDEPMQGPEIYRYFDGSVAHVRRFHAAVRKAAAAAGDHPDPAVIAPQVLADLGLSGMMPSPFLAQVILADLEAQDPGRVLGE